MNMEVLRCLKTTKLTTTSMPPTSPARAYIERLAEAAGDVVLDLSKVRFIDSSGLGALVFLHKRLVSKGHKLKIVGLKGQPLQLLTNLHLVPIFCG